MNDLQTEQNDALNQAAYKSVEAGQNAFSKSLQDAISAGNFTNSARVLPINEIYALLQNSPTEYEKNMQMYQIQNSAENRINTNKAANAQAQNQLGMNIISGAAGALMGLL